MALDRRSRLLRYPDAITRLFGLSPESPNPLLFFRTHASLNSHPQITPSPSSRKPTRRPTLRRRKPTPHRRTPRHPRPPHRRRWKPLEIRRHTARGWKRHRRTSILRRAGRRERREGRHTAPAWWRNEAWWWTTLETLEVGGHGGHTACEIFVLDIGFLEGWRGE